MAATTTLQFVPFDVKRSISLGGTAKRVVMTGRSPSPPPVGITRSTPASTPRRITTNSHHAPSPVVKSTPVASTASGSQTLVPNGKPSAPTTPASTAPPTPSRKGKEREHVPNGSALANGLTNGTPNGTPNGVSTETHDGERERERDLPNGKLNGATTLGTPNGTPKRAEASRAPAGKGKAAGSAVNLSWPAEIASVRRPPAGLHNGSMACYTNATIQVLMNTPPLLHQALAHRQEDCILHGRSKYCMLCALRQIATTEHWAGKKRAYRPQQIHNNLGQIKKGFSRHRQEDAHEFFRFVTDALQNSVLAGKPKNLPEKDKHATWVYGTWGGRVRSRVLCLSCKKPSDTFDNFLDLSLDVPSKARSLGDLFKGFVHEDKLDGDNKYNCENCKRKSAATKSMRVADAPPVLTLHLKRFGFSMTWPGRMTKMNNQIEYPAMLDLAPVMTEGPHEDGTKYRLFAVTCHHGSSLHYGHYTSYVQAPDGKWYNADDDDVSPVKQSTVLNDRSAYLLSYIRVGPAGANGAPSTPKSQAAGKRVRDEDNEEAESPSSAKRAAVLSDKPFKRPALAPRPIPKENGLASPFDRLMNYQSDASEGEGDAKSAKGKGKEDKENKDDANSESEYESDSDSGPAAHPIPRKFGSALKAARQLKSKHHRVHTKQDATGTPDFGFPRRGHGKPSGPAHQHKRRGAPMPFAQGHMRANMRNLANREVGMKRKKREMMRRRGE